jgi:thiol-disulfide isomerase/thioredoxin
MFKNLIAALAVIIFAGLLTFGLNHYFKTNKGDFFILEKGQAVPDFSFKTMDGETHTLYNFQGKKTIIHFWATWCAPCIVEFPELIAMANKNPDTIILAFSSDRNPAVIDRFFDKHDFNIPANFKIIHDGDQSITEGKFSVFALPESFILNTNMTLEDHIVGAYMGWADNER